MSNEFGLPDIYLSFFMFTTNLSPDNIDYRDMIINHIRNLKELGYTGFEFPIAAPETPDYPEYYTPDYYKEVSDYENLRSYLDSQGLYDVKISTNVGTTKRFDPSSPDYGQQQEALEYLKSRVDITAALRGEIMMDQLLSPMVFFRLKTMIIVPSGVMNFKNILHPVMPTPNPFSMN